MRGGAVAVGVFGWWCMVTCCGWGLGDCTLSPPCMLAVNDRLLLLCTALCFRGSLVFHC